MIGVLTGDLIGSTALTPDQLAIVRARLEEVAAVVAAARGEVIRGGPQFFRGDSWQMAVEARCALEIAVAARAAMIGLDVPVDTRVAIGIGSVDRLNAAQVSLSLGTAFTRSGRLLDGMKRQEVFAIDRGRGDGDWIVPVVALCGVTLGKMPSWHAEVGWRWLAAGRPAQKIVAKGADMSEPSVSEALAQSGIREIAAVADMIGRALSDDS